MEPLAKANVHDLYYFWVDNLPDQLRREEYEIHSDSCAQSGDFEKCQVQFMFLDNSAIFKIAAL